MAANDILTIACLNVRGQSGLTTIKQLQIEPFEKTNKCYIIHLQEAHIESETFSTCDFIQSSFNIVDNNGNNKYGTASGDFNCIVSSMDTTHYPEAKMSPGLKRLIKLKEWKDSFRILHPSSKVLQE